MNLGLSCAVCFFFFAPPLSLCSTLFPYPPLFRSVCGRDLDARNNPASLVRDGATNGSFGLGLTETETGQERSEDHTSELQSRGHLVCRLLLEKKKQINRIISQTQYLG